MWWRGSSLEALKNGEYHFIAIAPRSTLTQNGSTQKGPISQIEQTLGKQKMMLNCDSYIAIIGTI